MSDFLQLFRSGKFFDNTAMIGELLERRRWHILSGTKGTGMTTFLSTLEYFLDETYDMSSVFEKLDIAKSPVYKSHLNHYRVFKLDFSDFKCSSYNEALQYMKEKMSVLYKQHIQLVTEPKRFLFTGTWEFFLDVIEMKEDERGLEHSLDSLLKIVYFNKKNSALLIDNLVLVEEVSRKEGYGEQMRKFLERFIVEDVYKFCCIFVQIGDLESGSDSSHDWHYKPYCCYFAFSIFASDIHRGIFSKFIVSPDSQYQLEAWEQQMEQEEEIDWDDLVADQRRRLKEAMDQEQKREEEEARRRLARFQKELSPKFPKVSANLGIREYQTDPNTEAYQRLNQILIGLYDTGARSVDQIYRTFQKVHFDKKTDVVNEADFYKKQYFETAAMGCWEDIWINSDQYWNYFMFSNEDGFNPTGENALKIYVSWDTDAISEFFVNAVLYFIQNMKNSFAVKVTKCSRTDHMCFWISPGDFVILEEYFQSFTDRLKQTMDFIAYRNRLGISRDFGSEVSHNYVQANIICSYFKTVTERSDISIQKMYDLFVQAWNGQSRKDNPFRENFMDMSVRPFLVIMDTLDVLLEKVLVEDTVLFLDDSKMWKCFDNSICWGDLDFVVK